MNFYILTKKTVYKKCGGLPIDKVGNVWYNVHKKVSEYLAKPL